MDKISPEKLKEIIESHGKWLRNEEGGVRANLAGANLSRAILDGANLDGANLARANLYEASLAGANLDGANLYEANLYGAILAGANLSGAILDGANLSRAILYGAKGIPDTTIQFSFLDKLEKTSEGYIVYKTFGQHYSPPEKWEIKEGSIINEFCDTSLFTTCSHGINVATLDWVKQNTSNDIWKCLIKFEWLVGVTIPLKTDGKIRTARVQLIENIGRG